MAAPEVAEALKGMGVSGAIISVLMFVIATLSSVIAVMYKQANKVYGYRLAERDVLNKALTDASKVLGDLLDDIEDRNDLTEKQAALLSQMSSSFEMLKVTIIAQFEAVKENHVTAMDTHRTVAQAVAAMAESIRVMHAMILENRITVAGQVDSVKTMLQDGRSKATEEIRQEIRGQTQSILIELRKILGDGTVVKKRVIHNQASRRPKV